MYDRPIDARNSRTPGRPSKSPRMSRRSGTSPSWKQIPTAAQNTAVPNASLTSRSAETPARTARSERTNPDKNSNNRRSSSSP